MFGKRRYEEISTENGVDKLRKTLAETDAVIIGAGSGLSTSAGFVYTGERFREYFRDFQEKYDFHDMYSGGFYPYDTLEEHWAYWSRYIWINRYMTVPKPVYTELLQLVQDKDYFVLTTNVDHQFQKAGFDKQRLFYTQGDYGLFQCSQPCCQETYDNEQQVREMVLAQGYQIKEDGSLQKPITEHPAMAVPTELVTHCPNCGKPMSMNLRADDTFVEDEGWHKAAEKYMTFIKLHQDKKVLFLELGTGMNTPGIIKYPFWRMTKDWKNASYACINMGEAYAPDDIRDKSICINKDIGTVLHQL